MRVTLLTRTLVLFGAFTIAGSAAFAQHVEFPSGALGLAIPDRPTTGCDGTDPGPALTHSIVVPDAGTVTDVDVYLDITHTWIGDLTIILDNGTVTDTLVAKPGVIGPAGCGSLEDNFDNFVDDEGTDGTIEDDFPYTPGGRYTSYMEDGGMDAFDGQPTSGTWTLSIYDSGGGDTGTLNSWSLWLDGVIPVELTSFTATANGMGANLAWETASETNNAGFEVQVQNGESWNTLGWVEGHGTTTEAQSYSYTANDLGVGTHVFRLKQIDFDGMFEYHGNVEISLGTPGTHVLTSAYPNPFNPQSNFTLAVSQNQHVTAELYNALGQRVATLYNGTVEADQIQNVTIDGAGLASGTYIVRVNGETFADALRVTLLK